MSQAEDHRKAFTDIFNNILGNKIGKPLQFKTDAQLASSVPQAARDNATYVRSGLSTVKTKPLVIKKVAVPKKAKTAASTPASVALNAYALLHGGTSTPTPVAPTVTAPVNIPVDKNAGSNLKISSGGINPGQAQQDAVNNQAFGSESNQDQNVGNLDLVGKAHGISGAIEGALTTGVDKALGIVARPLYTVTGALTETAKAVNKGESIWSLPDNFLYGAWRGVSGQAHQGGGTLIHEAKYGDTGNRSALSKALFGGLNKNQTRVNPTTGDTEVVALDSKGNTVWKSQKALAHGNKWQDRIEGAITDVTLDPLTHYHGGSVLAPTGTTASELSKGAEAGNIGIHTASKVLQADGKDAIKNILQKSFTPATVATGSDAIKQEVKTLVSDVLANQTDHPLIRDLSTPVRKGMAQAGVKMERTYVIDQIAKDVADRLDNFIFDTAAGPTIGGKAADAHSTIAQITAESVRTKYFDIIQPFRDKFVAAVDSGTRFNDVQFTKMAKSNPIFADWLDAAKEAQMAGKTSDTVKEIGLAADTIFLNRLEPKITEVYTKMIAGLDNIVMKIPTITLMGHTSYLTSLGKFNDAVSRLRGVKGDNLNKAFNYSSWFPGATTHMAQRQRALSVAAFDDFRAKVKDALIGTTISDRRVIHDAIQEGRILDGHLAAPQAFIKKAYKEIYWEEVANGGRNAEITPYADNYVFNQIKSGQNDLKSFKDEWMDPKKLAVKKTKSIDGFTSVEAKAKGLGVETDAGEALLARKVKSVRELSRFALKTDLVTHYGIKSSTLIKGAAERNLSEVSRSKFPEMYKGLKETDHLYLDKDIMRVYDKFVSLTSLKQTSEANDLLKSFDHLTAIFKEINTVYFPAFQIRNAAGDVFMGALDGVKAKNYTTIFKASLKKDTSIIDIGGERIAFHKLYDSYHLNAASAGYYATDLGNLDTFKTGLSELDTSGRLNLLGSARGGARKASAVREDFGRMVHYYHAMDEELAFQLKRGTPFDKAWKNAEEASLARVNKFKFDYNALTETERSIKRFAIPFYTYMRKATPVLMQALYMNPKYFSYVNRLQRSLAPSQDFQGAHMPNYMINQATSLLGGSDSPNPVGFTDSLFPSRTLKETLSNPVTRANPIIQGAFELNSGKDTFTGRPVQKGLMGLPDVLQNKFRGFSLYSSLNSDTKPTLEKIAGFFGIPIVVVTKARQDGKTKQLEADLNTKVTSINDKLQAQGFKIRVTKGQIVVYQPKSPTPDELRLGTPPKYPINPKEKVMGTYSTFKDIPLKV